jgi:pyruvate/2-oxoacid:ferredoxin oxidoreductase alpha subunit
VAVEDQDGTAGAPNWNYLIGAAGIFATGKIAHEAMGCREKNGGNAAVVRVEQLYPWPEDQIADAIARDEHEDRPFSIALAPVF